MAKKHLVKKLNMFLLFVIFISLLSWPVSAFDFNKVVSEKIENNNIVQGIFGKVTSSELKTKEEKISLLQGENQIHDLRPTIWVHFDQEVNPLTVDVSISNYSDTSLVYGRCMPADQCNGIFDFGSNLGNKTFIYYLNEDLIDGEGYVVKATAEDLYGNPSPAPIEKEFWVVLLAVDITVIEPEHLTAVDYSFNVTAETSDSAECRYYRDNDKPFSEMLNFSEVSIDSITHKIIDFPDSGTLYVKCNDTDGKMASESFELVVDRSNPVIDQAYADPANVIQTPQTTLFVETNEDTICKYSNETDNYSLMDKFPGYDEDEFAEIHNITVRTSTDEGTYTYNVGCEDKGPRYSDIETIDFEVDFSQTLSIIINSPDSFSRTSIKFNITLNKDSDCWFTDNETDPRQNKWKGTTSLVEAFEPTESKSITLSSGSYKYYFNCRAVANASDEDSEEFNFQIDTTEPEMLEVDDTSKDYIEDRIDDPDKTYKTDELYVLIRAQDNETEIIEFNYKIVDDDGDEVDSGTIDDLEDKDDGIYEYKKYIEDLDLKNDTEYFFKVKAKNSAGLESTEMRSDGILVDTSLEPENCNNDRKDGDETDVDCGGSCSVKCNDGKDCESDSDCKSDVCDDKECQEATCSDDVHNQDETDVDCGGDDCDECEAGDECEENSDCKSGYCSSSSGECVNLPERCDDDTENYDETDVDCGGDVCDKCEVGDSCVIDADCVSGAKCIDDACKSCAQNDLDCDGKDNCEDNDIDGDGMKNWEDIDDDNDGTPDTTDTDDDEDGKSDPNDKDCDDDLDNNGMRNCDDEDIDGDGIKNSLDTDDDNDGLVDSKDDDDDNDGVDDYEEDCDDDGLADGWELRYCDGNCNPNDDLDGDGLTNLEEYSSGYDTDPTSTDSDNDGYSDKKEIEKGTDPADPSDYPKSNFLLIILIIFVVGLLIGGGIYGWKVYQTNKSKPTPIRRMPPMQSGARMPVRPMQRPMATRRALTPEERKKLEEVVEKRRKAKELERKNLFGAFSGKKEAKPGKPVVQKARVKPAVKVKTPGVKEPEKKDIFSRLSNLDGKKQSPTKKETKDVFKQLSSMAKVDTSKHKEIKKGLSEIKSQDKEIKKHVTNLKKELTKVPKTTVKKTVTKKTTTKKVTKKRVKR